jgi:hypothetical protein
VFVTTQNSFKRLNHALEPNSSSDVRIFPQYHACSGVLEEHFGYAASPHTIQVLSHT